jgi:hypothetical protein
MTEEQKQILETIVKELGGKVEYLLCSDLHSRHRKIVIEYEHLRKN